MRNCAHSNPKAGVVLEGAAGVQCFRDWTRTAMARSVNLSIANFLNAHGSSWVISARWIQMAMAILIRLNKRRPVAVCVSNLKTEEEQEGAAEATSCFSGALMEDGAPKDPSDFDELN